MFKVLILLAVTGSLAACNSEAKRKAIFIPRCTGSGFTLSQCDFLFAMAERAASDSDDAVALGLVSGMATGAAMGGGRR